MKIQLSLDTHDTGKKTHWERNERNEKRTSQRVYVTFIVSQLRGMKLVREKKWDEEQKRRERRTLTHACAKFYRTHFSCSRSTLSSSSSSSSYLCSFLPLLLLLLLRLRSIILFSRPRPCYHFNSQRKPDHRLTYCRWHGEPVIDVVCQVESNIVINKSQW